MASAPFRKAAAKLPSTLPPTLLSKASQSMSERRLNAVVVSAGLMQKTVKVRVGNQTWSKRARKFFNTDKHYLVHDPASSLRIGDVISISPGWRVSKSVRHVVREILAPFGSAIEDRPAVPLADELIEERERKAAAKMDRRTARGVGRGVGFGSFAAAAAAAEGVVPDVVEQVRNAQVEPAVAADEIAEEVVDEETAEEIVDELIEDEEDVDEVEEDITLESATKTEEEPPKKRGWFS